MESCGAAVDYAAAVADVADCVGESAVIGSGDGADAGVDEAGSGYAEVVDVDAESSDLAD